MADISPISPLINTSSPSQNLASLPISDPPPQPIPPSPEPPPLNQAATTPPEPQTVETENRQWTNLFAKKPRNAGVFSHPPMQLQYSGNALKPTEEIYEAGKKVWSDYLVGFFLDAPLSFTAVTSRLRSLWKPRGSIKIKSTGSVFFFLFSDPQDRQRILYSDSILIRGKIFIVKPWECSVGSNYVRSVPMWIKLYNIPLYAWSHVGLCWLSTHIGRFLCFDAATETLDRLSFAKILVEVTPMSKLPNEFPALLPDGSEQSVRVEYTWRPDICKVCNSFGHTSEGCKIKLNNVVVNDVEVSKPDNPVSTKFIHRVVRKESRGNDKQGWTRVVNKKNNQDSALTNGGNTAVLEEVDLLGRNTFAALSEGMDAEVVNDVHDREIEEGEIRHIDEILTKAFTPFGEASDLVKDHRKNLILNTSEDVSDQSITNAETVVDNGGQAACVDLSAKSIPPNTSNIEVVIPVYVGLTDKAKAPVTSNVEAEPHPFSDDQAVKAVTPSSSIKPGFLNISPARPKHDSISSASRKGTSEPKEKLTKNLNPYANIPAPPGFKEPPPWPDNVTTPHSPISASHTYITRSKKSVMGVGSLFDND